MNVPNINNIFVAFSAKKPTFLSKDGLVFSIDAGNAKSYSGSGTNVLDPINNLIGVMNNGVGFSTSIGGYF